MATRILFFGSLKETAGGERMVDLPAKVKTPQQLIDWLGESDAGLKAALDAPSVRVAMDQVVVGRDHALKSPREIAFMPPFSGG